MLLEKLTIRNFRCYADLVDIPFHRLTVFIGENDAGKTVLLDALEILLTNKSPVNDDYRRLDDERRADTIVLSGGFSLENHDTLPEDYRTNNGTELRITKTFTAGTMVCEIVGRGYVDARFDTFAKQSAEVQKELLQGLGIQPESNAPKRGEQFQEAIQRGAVPKQDKSFSVNFGSLVDHLPRFQYTSSVDYKQPDSMIQQTLQTVVDACVRPKNPETGEPELLPELSTVKTKINTALNSKVAEMEETLRRINPKVKALQVSPSIDFSRSVTAKNLMLDLGNGFQLVNAFGEGTKKKLWMGLLEWERQVQQETGEVSTFRVYDEPDVNLDYAAERKLFSNILEMTSKIGSQVQAVVCTHALTLIDRAPAHSINLIKASTEGLRTFEYLKSDDQKDVEDFLATVGRSVGITNSALFYERAFLVVEGESEENALPILYRHLYGHSLIEDGIVLIDLFTCGAWKSVLKILQRNKSHVTIMLLDKDCTSPESSAYVTLDVLREVGFPEAFQSADCFFVGTKEFEDAFRTEDIIDVLNAHWPKEDGTAWSSADIDAFRKPEAKFSEDLKQHVIRSCIKPRRNAMRKPEFAEKLAQRCSTAVQIPDTIQQVFRYARVKSGIEIVAEAAQLVPIAENELAG